MRTKRNLGTKEVNGERFMVIQGEQTLDSVLNRNIQWDRSFWELYDRPSQTKINIYEYWERFFHSLGIYDIKCQGSCMTFSITAYNHETGEIYYITKCYNRLYIPKVA